jgi:hypothetical protein
MTNPLPVRTRTYQNHVFDSTYWDQYAPRPGDVIIATSYKSGTTWTQNIVLQLIFAGSQYRPFLRFHLSWSIAPPALHPKSRS